MTKEILVADDDLMISMLVSEYLKSQGHTVSVVHSGNEVMQYLKQKTPALLILDFIMPEMNGLEVLKEVRNSEHKNLKIIFLSAEEDASNICQREGVAADCYLLKPFDLDELLQKVAELL